MTDTQEAMRRTEKFMREAGFIRTGVSPAWVRFVQVVEQAATAQSAEKIARLEAENASLGAQIDRLNDQCDDWKEKLAAAELSNKKLLGYLHQLASIIPDGFVVAQNTISEALAQQPSTEALDAYVANINPWISVKSKLPENHKEVLARETDGCIYELRFVQERDESCTYNSWYDCDGNRYGDVAHWMPLPPAKKE